MLRSTGGPGPGDIVTCEDGHELLRVIRHMQRWEPIRASAFERVCEKIPEPTGGKLMNPYCHCGKPWLRPKQTGGCQAHFKGHGWWPGYAGS